MVVTLDGVEDFWITVFSARSSLLSLCDGLTHSMLRNAHLMYALEGQMKPQNYLYNFPNLTLPTFTAPVIWLLRKFCSFPRRPFPYPGVQRLQHHPDSPKPGGDEQRLPGGPGNGQHRGRGEEPGRGDSILRPTGLTDRVRNLVLRRSSQLARLGCDLVLFGVQTILVL